MRSPEILAPAGSMESLIAAVRCGADAVYLGGTMYSARSSAANFDLTQLREASDLCRLHGVGLHLAVNTLLTDTELPAFADYIRQAAPLVDACIVQDLGALRLMRALVPDMILHASTQMSIHTPEGAQEAASLGCSRVVAAREMPREDLAALCRLPVEVEVFVHGALCMSVSGQCSFSALAGGRSANRGACAQACRLPFRTPGGKNPAALSLKDLSLVEHVRELQDMGVSSFKIEGRMKRPEYVAAAVTALRMALAGEQPDLDTLQAVFSRSGFTDGYFTGKKRDMFGWRRKEDVQAGQQVLQSLQGLYAQERPVSELAFTMHLAPGIPAVLEASDPEGHAVTVSGEIPQIPQRSPLTEELLVKSMQKLGGSPYTFGGAVLDNPDSLFLSASQCNAMRREAAEAMNRLRIGAHTPECRVIPGSITLPDKRSPGMAADRLHVRTAAQYQAAAKCGGIICIPLTLAEDCTPDASVWLEAPRIIADEAAYRKRLGALYQKGFRHLVCHNLADVRIGRETGFVLHGGFGLNTANRLTAEMLEDAGIADVTASIELRWARIRDLGRIVPVGAIVYGRLPMMLLRVCPIRAQEGCRRQKGCIMTDRTGRQFPLMCSGDYQELVNSEILWLADRMPAGLDYHDFYFTDESPARIPEVVAAYHNGGAAPEHRTRGLYEKGGLR